MAQTCRLLVIVSILTATATVADGASSERPRFENDRLRVQLTPRTPDQIAAFYIARGFPAPMVQQLRDVCFITVVIRNKSDDIVWLELDRWEFTAPGGAIRRFDRRYWKDTWREANAPLPSQVTFRWTLLPEVLDFRPSETEGGNVTLERTAQPFAVEATFATGRDKQGEPIHVHFSQLRCAPNPTP